MTQLASFRRGWFVWIHTDNDTPPLYAVVMINFKTFQEARILKLTVEEFCLEEFGDVEKE